MNPLHININNIFYAKEYFQKQNYSVRRVMLVYTFTSIFSAGLI